MKYSIEMFSQEYAISLKKTIERNGKQVELKLDCTDLVILRWFVDYYPFTDKIDIDGVQYAWVSHKKLCDDLPIIDISKRAFGERMQKLVELDILEYKLLKENGTFSLYRFGKNYRNLVASRENEGYAKNSTRCAFKQHRGSSSNDIGVYVQTATKDITIKDTSINKENYIKESCEIRNGNQVTTSFVVNNENLVHAQSVEIGTGTPTSTNTNMFVVNNDRLVEQQKLDLGTNTPSSSKNNKVSANNIVSVETINEYFDKTYEIYPKKVSKEQAKKTYEHKFRGLEQEDARKLANYIYINLEKQVQVWGNEYGGKGREREFVPHMSTWLNDNIPDSPHFKGKKQ